MLYHSATVTSDAATRQEQKAATLWRGEGASRSAAHLAFSANNRAAVNSVYAAAIAAGGHDNGNPSLRPDHGANYYAAFVIEPDGDNAEAVCHQA